MDVENNNDGPVPLKRQNAICIKSFTPNVERFFAQYIEKLIREQEGERKPIQPQYITNKKPTKK